MIVFGVESMFRLINAVLTIPAEQPTAVRIASALGEVGFISFVAMATNLAILIIIGSISAQAIREFCVFACIAILLDYILHMTFFLAVLSVDVRRLELQESIDRLMLSLNEEDESLDPAYNKQQQSSLFDYFIGGASPLSSRIAGSVIVCIISRKC